jgi:vancomycin resistance protein YoaR
VLLLSCVAVGAVLVAGAGAALAATGEGVPDGTRVRGMDIGGLSQAEAVARVDGAFTAERTSSISLVAADAVLQLDPKKAGIDLDAEATVEEALDVGAFDRLKARLGAGRDVDPVPSYDEERLRLELERLKKQFDREPREGAVRFTPEAVPVEARPLTGRSLDVPGSIAALRSSYLQLRVEVPVEVEDVKTTPEQVRTVRDEVALPAVAAPVTVDVGGDPLVVEPIDIAKALRLEADDDGKIEPVLDAEVLHERVQGRLRTVGTPAVDATFETASGKPVLVPSKPGRSVSADDLSKAVLGVLTDEKPRRATAPLTVSQPRVTTEVARGLGIKEVIGTFTTRHPCCRPRVENIHRIADIVDGYVLRPGDQFDLNGYVGPRDKARGFQEAPQILEGQFVDRVGGGVSQFATTIFNAVFFSGLKDITHTPHSYYISRYPAGREATVSFPLPDLIFENDSPHGVLVDTSYTGTSITVTFWGTKRFDEVRSISGPRTRIRDFGTEYVDRDDCTATDGAEGFDIVVTRVFVKGGKEVGREDFKTRYKPEPRFICGKAPRRARSASPAPTGG